MKITQEARLLHLRVLALRNACLGYEPHQWDVERLVTTPITKLRFDARRINWLAWRYRRQISPELVPQIRNVWEVHGNAVPWPK